MTGRSRVSTGDERIAENFLLSTVATLMGLTIVYVIGTDVLGAERQGFRNLYLIGIVFFAVALAIRFLRLRADGTRILFGRLPPFQRGDEKRYFAWLLAAAALGAYSVYEVALRNGEVFLITCLLSTLLMLVIAVGLARPGSGSGREVQ